jgi:hypothetical protein
MKVSWKYDRFKNKMQNSSYRNKITFNSTSKIHRIYFMKLFAANRETFGPKMKSFMKWENLMLGIWKLCFTLYVHSMYSKGNEQVLGKEKSWEKENKILWVVFFLFNFRRLQSSENLFCFFHLVTSFVSLLYV